jgi:hypothetical protein
MPRQIRLNAFDMNGIAHRSNGSRGMRVQPLMPVLRDRSLRPIVDRSFALSEIDDAQRPSQAGQATRQIVS